jgi:hypothetical protein
MYLTKPFDSGLGQYMPKAVHPSGGMDLLNPHRWRGKLLHHHGEDVCCVFVLCVSISRVVCKKVPEYNLKVQILPYYKVSRHYIVPHIGLHHTHYCHHCRHRAVQPPTFKLLIRSTAPLLLISNTMGSLTFKPTDSSRSLA